MKLGFIKHLKTFPTYTLNVYINLICPAMAIIIIVLSIIALTVSLFMVTLEHPLAFLLWIMYIPTIQGGLIIIKRVVRKSRQYDVFEYLDYREYIRGTEMKETIVKLRVETAKLREENRKLRIKTYVKPL